MAAALLLAATLVTDGILILIVLQTQQLRKSIQTRFARLQATVVALLCLAGLVASVQDVGFHAIRLGWLPSSLGGRFLNAIQAVLVLGGLSLLAPTLIVLRRLTGEFARTEGIADTFVDRLPDGLSLETAGLTKRELEVVVAIGTGKLSDREIAETFTISPATAATHVRNIMRKTGVSRRADLALLAQQLPK